MCVPHSFTIKEIAETLYKIGAPDYVIAAEICGLNQLFGKTINYKELTGIMSKAKGNYESSITKYKELQGDPPIHYHHNPDAKEGGIGAV